MLAPLDHDSVVPGHGHIVQKYVAVGPATDGQARAIERECLTGAATARADDEHRSASGDLLDRDLLELAGLTDPVGGRRIADRVLGRRR